MVCDLLFLSELKKQNQNKTKKNRISFDNFKLVSKIAQYSARARINLLVPKENETWALFSAVKF